MVLPSLLAPWYSMSIMVSLPVSVSASQHDFQGQLKQRKMSIVGTLSDFDVLP